MIRLVIVDDHTLFREGLASILNLEEDIEVSELAGSVQEAVEVVRKLKPEIILMDFFLPDGNGADATRLVLAEHPECKIIFLTMSEQDENLFAAIRSGAKGYLLKNLDPSKLLASIRAVHQGESAISTAMTLRLMDEFSRTKAPDQVADSALDVLTPREIDVLRELTSKFTNQEIAEHLVISKNTVKYHIRAILDKLNLSNRTEAAEFARKHGIMD